MIEKYGAKIILREKELSLFLAYHKLTIDRWQQNVFLLTSARLTDNVDQSGPSNMTVISK
jgi:hypothetical protein